MWLASFLIGVKQAVATISGRFLAYQSKSVAECWIDCMENQRYKERYHFSTNIFHSSTIALIFRHQYPVSAISAFAAFFPRLIQIFTMQFKLTFITALFAASAIAAPVASNTASCSNAAIAALQGATKQVSDLNSNLSGTTTAASLVSAIVTGLADDLTTLLNGIVLPCEVTLTSQDQQDICDAATTV